MMATRVMGQWAVERESWPVPRSHPLSVLIALLFQRHPDLQRFQLTVANEPHLMVIIRTPGFVIPFETRDEIFEEFARSRQVEMCYDSRISVLG